MNTSTLPMPGGNSHAAIKSRNTAFNRPTRFLAAVLFVFALLFGSTLKAQFSTNAGLPIAYWDFENNASRSTGELTVEQQANTGNTYDGKFGGSITSTFGTTGNGLNASYGGLTAGSCILAQSWSTVTSDPGTGATTYFQFTFNTTGFTGESVSVDVMAGTTTATYPYVGVEYSTNGGASYTAVTVIDPGNNTWKNNLNFTLPAAADNNANVKLRIYGYFGANTTASTMSIDNLAVFAKGTVLNTGSKTGVNESAVFTGYTSGKTGSQWLRYGTFTVSSGSTFVLGTGGIALGSVATAGALTVSNGGTLDCGGITDQKIFTVPSGLSTFTLASGGSIIIRNSGGIAASGATGSIQTTTRNFNTGANYTYSDPLLVVQSTGTGLPATVNNLSIANSAGVNNTQAVNIAGILALTSGIYTTTTSATVTVTNPATAAVTGGSTTAFVNGPLNWALTAGLSSFAGPYVFPVGSGSTYLPYSLSSVSTGGTSPVLQVTAFNTSSGGSPDNATVSSISGTEYWQTKVVSGNYSGASLSLTRQTAVGPSFNVIAKSLSTVTPVTTYSSLGGSAAANSVNNSGQTGAIAAGASQFNLFSRSSFNIVSSTGANGTISPLGTTNVTSGNNQLYNITPNACYHIADVLVDGVSAGAVSTYTFSNVTATHTISATFVQNTFPITVTAGTNGAITPGTGSVNCGSNATYTIAPNACYSIADVVVDGVSQGAVGTYTFTNVQATHTISATFVLNTYTITVTAGANGSITPATGSVNCGDNATYTITANSCYSIADVVVDGVSQGAVGTYTFTNVTANHTISATFVLNTYAITVTAGANGSITPATGSVNCGSNATYTITPNACYSIASVVVDGVSQGAVGAYTFTNVTATHTISATFVLNTYTITVSAGANGSITPATGSVNCGDNATYTITANACYSIADVVVDGVSQGAVGTYTFTNVTANHTISATFVLNTYTITATAGTGGSITPATGSVNCGDNATYTITANACYSIADVVVDGVSQGAVGTYTFTNVTANHTISATFVLNTYTITATAGTGGSITPATGSVNCGDNATYAITPNACYSIADVVVDGVSQGAVGTYTFTNVTADHTISATFVLNTYTITATAGTGGSITPATGSVNCGDNATYTITPNTCYSIADVVVDGVSQGAVGTYTFTNVTADHTISATFVLNTYTITVTAGANGSVSPATGSVNCGDNATYTITANACYSIADVVVDGVSQGAVGTYTFTNVTADHTISATFVLNTYAITVTAAANGSITPATGSVNCGDNATYTITPNACYSIADVVVDGVSQGAVGTYTFTNVAADHTISATFVLNTYMITVTAAANGSITPATGSVNCGDNATYTITPNACYSIADVVVDGVSQGAVGTYTFTNVTADHTISATFVLNTYTITATAGTGGSITPATGSVNCGDNATYTITPNTCYSIADVVVDGVSQGAVGTYTFTNVTATHTISASFVQNTYTITVNAGPNGSIAPGTAVVNCGSNNTYTITADACNHIVDVTIDGVSQGAVGSVSVNNVSTNHTVAATFAGNANLTAPVVTGPVNVCQYIGTATQVTYTASSNIPVNYSWLLPPNVNPISSTANSITVTFSAGFTSQANKQIRVTASSPCSASQMTIYYLLSQLPNLPTPITGTTSVCSVIAPIGGTLTYTIRSVLSATDYIWTIPSGATVTHPNGSGVNDTTITLSFSNSFATSELKVTAHNDCGLSPVRSLTLTRTNPGTAGLISGTTNVCENINSGPAATYKIPVVAAATSYNWNVSAPGAVITHPNGLGATDTVVNIVFPNFTGTTTVTVSATNGCGTGNTRSLSVSKLVPGTPAKIDVEVTQPCPNRLVQYKLGTGGGGLPTNATSLVWTVPSQGTIVSDQYTGTLRTSITVSYSAAVDSVVSVQAINNCGSSSVRTTTAKYGVCVAGKPLAKGGTVTPATEMLNVNVFPNPSVSDFKLQVLTAGKELIHVRILDMQGRVFKTLTVMPYQTTTVGSDLKAGAYMLEVTQGNKVKTTKLLKF